MGQWQNTARTRGTEDPLSRVVQAVVNPLGRALTGGANAGEDFFSGVGSARALAQENRILRKQIAAASLYAERERVLATQNDQLRRILGLPVYGGKKRIPTDVVGYFPHENRITISAGRPAGVTPGLAVVAPDGLVGVVQVVGETSSQVTLLSSPNQRIGGLVLRTPPLPGILRGESAERLNLEFLDTSAPMQIGDWVVTSGFSERIPRGIPIGRIVKLEPVPGFGTRRAYIYPSVRLGMLHELFVLK